MLTHSLFNSLSKSTLYKHVVDSNFIGYSDYCISGKLTDLTQNISFKIAEVTLSINLTLTNVKTGQLVASKIFTLTKDTKPGAKNYAETVNIITQKLDNQIALWVYQNLEKEN